MSRLARRAVALLASAPLTAAALVVAAPAAHAAVLPTCTSTPIYDFTVAGGFAEKLAVDTRPGLVQACFTVAGGVGVLVVRPVLVAALPTVNQTPGTLPCPIPVFDSNQPVPIHLSVGADLANQSVCLSLNGQTTVFSIGPASVTTLPSLELWRSGVNDVLDKAACALVQVEYDLGSVQYPALSSCLYSGPTRIV